MSLFATVTNRCDYASTHDVQLRLVHHNDGWSRSTKSGRPWRIAYREEQSGKSSACLRERQIKRQKSRRHLPLRRESSIRLFFTNLRAC